MSASGEIPETTDKKGVLPVELGWRGVKFLMNPGSAKASARYAWSYARHTLLAAVVMTIAGLINAGGTWAIITKLKALGGTAENPASGTEFLTLLVWALVVVVFIFLFVFWGFGLWLVCVTSYVRSYLSGDVVGLSADQLQARHKEALAYVKTNRKFLAQFWLVVSAIGLIPIFVTASLFMVVYFFGAQIPREQVIAIECVELVLTVALMNYSFAALSVSSVTTDPPAKAAWKAFLLTFKAGQGLSVVSVLMLATSIVLSYPMVVVDPAFAFSLMTRGSSELTQNEFVISMVLQVWQGIVSVFVVTWWFGIAAECVRGSIE